MKYKMIGLFALIFTAATVGAVITKRHTERNEYEDCVLNWYEYYSEE